MQIGSVGGGVPVSRSRANVQAARILDLVEVDGSTHQIWQENLATYLHNLREPVPEKALTSLGALNRWLNQKSADYERMGTMGGLELGRWPSKIIRDVEQPYTDAEVGERLSEVSSTFESQVKRLRDRLPGYPRDFMAFGGSIHGRFGGHSDLDYLYREKNGKESGHGPYTSHPVAAGFAFAPDNFNPRKARLEAGSDDVVMGGPAVPLKGRAPWKEFEQLVRDRLEEKGLQVDEEWHVTRVAYPRRTYEDPATARERSQLLPEG